MRLGAAERASLRQDRLALASISHNDYRVYLRFSHDHCATVLDDRKAHHIASGTHPGNLRITINFGALGSLAVPSNARFAGFGRCIFAVFDQPNSHKPRNGYVRKTPSDNRGVGAWNEASI